MDGGLWIEINETDFPNRIKRRKEDELGKKSKKQKHTQKNNQRQNKNDC